MSYRIRQQMMQLPVHELQIKSLTGEQSVYLPAAHLPAAHLPAAHLPAAHLPAAHLPAAHLPAAHLPAVSMEIHGCFIALYLIGKLAAFPYQEGI